MESSWLALDPSTIFSFIFIIKKIEPILFVYQVVC